VAVQRAWEEPQPLKWHRAIPFVVLAFLASLATLMTAWFAFPQGTVDLDEVSYQMQANALGDGHLTLPAATYDPFFRPFLSGVRGDRVVFKYQPEWPAMIAASDLAFGSSLPLRALLGGGGVLAVAWLAWELARDRQVALVAAAVTTASPFTWVEAASLLSYQLFFVLAAAAAAALIRAINTSKRGTGVVAGVLVGCVVLHRPFDAILVLGPVLVYVAWQTSRQQRLGHLAVAVAMGAVGPLVVLGAYNEAVMGAVWRFPFGVTGAIDTFGFGWRGSFEIPGGGRNGQLHYTLGTAIHTIGHVLLVLPLFIALTPLVLGFAGMLVWARRRDSRVWVLVAMIATVFIGYFFWWSPANAARFGLDKALGPFYHYPLLAPLIVAAAWGAVTWWPRRRAAAGLVLLGVAWSVPASVIVMRQAGSQGQVRSAAVNTTDGSGPRLVFQAPLFVNDPYLRFADDVPVNGDRVVAVDNPGRRLDVIDRYPKRVAYLLRTQSDPQDPFRQPHQDRVRLSVTRSQVLRVHLHAVVAGERAGVAYLRVDDESARIGQPGTGSIDETWMLTSSTIGPHPNPSVVALGVALAPPGAPAPSSLSGDWYECRLEARTTSDGTTEALTPCDGWYHYVFPHGATATVRVDLSHLLVVSVSRG
jgi:4-amino-4-deoxy-L-arabinose transferase-like glycosyltransferase